MNYEVPYAESRGINVGLTGSIRDCALCPVKVNSPGMGKPRHPTRQISALAGYSNTDALVQQFLLFRRQ